MANRGHCAASRRARISASSIGVCQVSLLPRAVAIICSAQVYCLTRDGRGRKSGATAKSAKESVRAIKDVRISSRPGKERFEIGYTMPVLTGKEEVFAAVPEGLFTELLCAVTAAAEVKGMDLGLGIKAGCFRARRGERLRG